MNTSQLETFLIISKTLSFRKAGEILNLTQPAVSAQIKSLEEELGTVLIDRSQPISLTDRGFIFLEHAEKILGIIDDMKNRFSDLSMTPQGHIVLGTTTSIAIQILPRVLSYFQNQYPLIKTTIISMPSTQVLTAVENGSVDIGINYLYERSPNIKSSILYYDTYELVVAPNHPLAKKRHIDVSELIDVPMIMLSSDTIGRKLVDNMFRKFSIKPNIVMELSSSEEIKRMAELNLGAAFVSKLSVANEIRLGSLKIITVDDVDLSQPVGVAYRSGRYINSAMQQFISDLKGMPESHFIGSE